MTVGPKGQVVMPRAVHKAPKIQPGSGALFCLEEDRVVLRKQEVDAVDVFGRVARRGRSVRRISLHGYESELAARA